MFLLFSHKTTTVGDGGTTHQNLSVIRWSVRDTDARVPSASACFVERQVYACAPKSQAAPAAADAPASSEVTTGGDRRGALGKPSPASARED
jgi:hypothetical protein